MLSQLQNITATATGFSNIFARQTSQNDENKT